MILGWFLGVSGRLPTETELPDFGVGSVFEGRLAAWLRCSAQDPATRVRTSERTLNHKAQLESARESQRTPGRPGRRTATGRRGEENPEPRRESQRTPGRPGRRTAKGRRGEENPKPRSAKATPTANEGGKRATDRRDDEKPRNDNRVSEAKGDRSHEFPATNGGGEGATKRRDDGKRRNPPNSLEAILKMFFGFSAFVDGFSAFVDVKKRKPKRFRKS